MIFYSSLVFLTTICRKCVSVTLSFVVNRRQNEHHFDINLLIFIIVLFHQLVTFEEIKKISGRGNATISSTNK